MPSHRRHTLVPARFPPGSQLRFVLVCPGPTRTRALRARTRAVSRDLAGAVTACQAPSGPSRPTTSGTALRTPHSASRTRTPAPHVRAHAHTRTHVRAHPGSRPKAPYGRFAVLAPARGHRDLPGGSGGRPGAVQVVAVGGPDHEAGQRVQDHVSSDHPGRQAATDRLAATGRPQRTARGERQNVVRRFPRSEAVLGETNDRNDSPPVKVQKGELRFEKLSYPWRKFCSGLSFLSFPKPKTWSDLGKRRTTKCRSERRPSRVGRWPPRPSRPCQPPELVVPTPPPQGVTGGTACLVAHNCVPVVYSCGHRERRRRDQP